MSGTPQRVLYPQRPSHTIRNLALVILLLAVVGVGFFAPVFTVSDISPSVLGVTYNAQVKGSLTYLMFKCGEVYYSYSGSVYGQQVASASGYKWVCGQ